MVVDLPPSKLMPVYAPKYPSRSPDAKREDNERSQCRESGRKHAVAEGHGGPPHSEDSRGLLTIFVDMGCAEVYHKTKQLVLQER